MGRRRGTRNSGGSTSGKKRKSGSDPSPGRPESSRGKRIATLRDRVDDGDYRVDPEAVAEKMVDEAVRKIRSRIRPQ